MTLHVHEWGAGAPVLAVHGITASHLAWATVAGHLPGVRLIAPDLRGRGASSDLGAPFGMRQHADDIIGVLDDLGLDRVPLVGHSMGAFVALVTAHRYPDRVSRVLLVDGGLPLQIPAGYSTDTVGELLGPAAARLTMEFTDREAYREFWRAHPAFAGQWSSDLEAYVDYDLGGVEPHLRSRTSAEAMRADQLELYGAADVVDAIEQLTHPATLLWAPRGLQDETPGLYPPEVLTRWQARLVELGRDLSMEEVPDTNHYTIVMGEPGASVVAEKVRQLL